MFSGQPTVGSLPTASHHTTMRSRFATRHDGDEPKPRIPKRFPPLFLVFDAQAARRVLSDREFFDVELYDAKMRKAIGRFFLGLDYDDPEYKAQLALWHDIARGAHAAAGRDAAGGLHSRGGGCGGCRRPAVRP